MNLKMTKFFVIFLTIFVSIVILIFLYNFNVNVNLNLKQISNTRSNYKWVLNSNILQYSTYLIQQVENSDQLSIQVFIFQIDVNHEQLNCVVRGNRNEESVNLTVDLLIIINPPLMKAYCKINKSQLYSTTEAFVAVVNRNSSKRHDELLYQKAVYIDGTKKKIQGIGHCVHAMHGIDSLNSNRVENFDKWVQLQKSIGISEIRVYVHSLPDTVLEYFQEKYRGYVEFVDNRYKETEYCNFPEDEDVELCKKAKEKLNVGYCERMQTNDCYLNLRHKYEMVTNYDIDEIIFPRFHDINKNLKGYTLIECNLLCNYVSNRSYTLYDYAKQMFDKMDSKLTACLMFKHFPLVKTDKYLDIFFERIINITSPTILRYSDDTNEGISIRIENQENIDRLKLYQEIYKKLECLRDKNISKSQDSEFNRIFGFYSDGRFGKSIFNTNLVETVNQHSSDVMTPGTRKTELPLEFGYSMHFRDFYKGFYQNNKDYSINDIHLDIEYYLFILKQQIGEKIC